MLLYRDDFASFSASFVSVCRQLFNILDIGLGWLQPLLWVGGGMPYGCFVNPFDDSKFCSCQQYNCCLVAATIQNSVHFL